MLKRKGRGVSILFLSVVSTTWAASPLRVSLEPGQVYPITKAWAYWPAPAPGFEDLALTFTRLSFRLAVSPLTPLAVISLGLIRLEAVDEQESGLTLMSPRLIGLTLDRARMDMVGGFHPFDGVLDLPTQGKIELAFLYPANGSRTLARLEGELYLVTAKVTETTVPLTLGGRLGKWTLNEILPSPPASEPALRISAMTVHLQAEESDIASVSFVPENPVEREVPIIGRPGTFFFQDHQGHITEPGSTTGTANSEGKTILSKMSIDFQGDFSRPIGGALGLRELHLKVTKTVRLPFTFTDIHLPPSPTRTSK